MAMKAMHVACAYAVAAFKLRRPVKMYLDGKTDMIIAGGRHPMKAKYSVGFKSDGKITGIHLDFGLNAGIALDLSALLPSAIIGSFKKYNWGALAFDIKNPSLSMLPTLSVDTNTIRRRNLHDFDSLSVFYGKSAGKVSIMNDDSIAVEVGGIEIGQGLWTKVKQMTAFGLGTLCPDGGECLLDKMGVIQADSLSMIQGGFTGGSNTSENSCEAVRRSCTELVERLNPIKESLEAKTGTVEWSALIAQVRINLMKTNFVGKYGECELISAQAYWTPDPKSTSYLNYGAGICEVEIDVLTGATTILRSDLVYDCGQSLNPAVDLGQVEGAFIQGVGFFTNEEYATNSDGMVIHDGTWTYKIPTVDTIPKQFNVELINSAHDKKRVLSSKASGEPPLLLASSVHCAMREAIRAARKEFSVSTSPANSTVTFQMDVPATMPVVKELRGLDVVERYLESLNAGPTTTKA
ncbi:indole-3-acetaldehyde oxidase-like [Panicum miliaceum]|uniref:Indole-3-acetaldehyde oxidase-like n=1 Tax=Panicum miliaceum TaxID=4540 RepID=A0A3L6R852_PANMI|nr:indole-3-acetaldehyde oxidase-like [Panicum miliaceum]